MRSEPESSPVKLPYLIDFGLLVMRIGLGIMFLLHGYPKLFGGPEKWAAIGRMGVGSIGVDFWHSFWGFVAALSEFGGGIILISGFAFRTGLVFLFSTMVFASLYHITTGSGSPYHAIESAFVFVGLFLTGPGKYTLLRLVRDTQS